MNRQDVSCDDGRQMILIQGSYQAVRFGQIISRIAHSTYCARMLGFMVVRNVVSVSTVALSCRKSATVGAFRTTQVRSDGHLQ